MRHKYYLTGKCNRCGACCQQIHVRHAKAVISDEQEFKELQSQHKFYSYLEVIGKDEDGLVFRCKNFDKDKHICKIHKFRPLICRKYPDEIIFSMGAELGENCGYKFVPIESFASVMKKIGKKTIKSYIIFDK